MEPIFQGMFTKRVCTPVSYRSFGFLLHDAVSDKILEAKHVHATWNYFLHFWELNGVLDIS